MAVLMLGLHGGPAITKTVTLYAFFGYCLLVIAAILALRVLCSSSAGHPMTRRGSWPGTARRPPTTLDFVAPPSRH